MVFKFTGSASSPSPASDPDCLNVGIVTVHLGSNQYMNRGSRWGIGNEFDGNTNPAKRALEVHDQTGVQLRLTFDNYQSPNDQLNGIYTDLSTTSLGDFIIEPRNNDPNNVQNPVIQGNVGINTTAPTNTLDVNGTARIRTLNNSTGTVVVADANGVLFVDPSYTVGSITADNGLNMNPSTNVQLGGALIHDTEVSQNTHHLVFSNATGNFGIGRHFDGLTNLPANRFEV